MITILLVEDKVDLREFMKLQLELRGYTVMDAPDFRTAQSYLDSRNFDIIILDLKLPDGNSIRFFDSHRDALKGKSIIITANPTIPSVVEAIKKGAYNYIEKPFGIELLIAQIDKILELGCLSQENLTLKQQLSSDFTFDKIVYHGKAMEEVISRARILSKTDNTILIQGETGTGKEIFARAITNESLRKKENFLPINCAAIPAELFESELFGFEKGAFTGAVDSYCGRFVQAHNGTLFLDEIGELPLNIQAKLLRILDENIVYRLKSKDPLSVNVRLLTATNRILEEEVALGNFRDDLYYRLRESSIRIPPLRERPEDILPLTVHFIEIFNRIYNKHVTSLSSAAESFFLNYSWKGNVRELKNTIKSIIPFKKNNTIELDDFSHTLLEGKKIENKRFVKLEEHERRYIYEVLKVTHFNISRSAEILGLSRPRLYRRIEKLGLDNLVDEEMMS
ncbi:MAG: sigma-54-dependent Fis family transcriptional regulator [bacterium]|nr:sigma-54-dependent Fis family transcriptional regulator [bacterium]